MKLRFCLFLLLLSTVVRGQGYQPASNNGGNCGVNMSCQVGALTATTGAFSGAVSTGNLTCATLTATGQSTLRNVSANSFDGGYGRFTGAVDITGLLNSGGLTSNGNISTPGTYQISAGGALNAGFSNTNYLRCAGSNGGNPSCSGLGTGDVGISLFLQDGGVLGLGSNASVKADGTVSGSALIVGGGSSLGKRLATTAILDFPNISAGDCGELSVGLGGTLAGDRCAMGAPGAIEGDLTWQCYVADAGYVAARVCNVNLVISIDPVPASYSFETSR